VPGLDALYDLLRSPSSWPALLRAVTGRRRGLRYLVESIRLFPRLTPSPDKCRAAGFGASRTSDERRSSWSLAFRPGACISASPLGPPGPLRFVCAREGVFAQLISARAASVPGRMLLGWRGFSSRTPATRPRTVPRLPLTQARPNLCEASSNSWHAPMRGRVRSRAISKRWAGHRCPPSSSQARSRAHDSRMRSHNELSEVILCFGPPVAPASIAQVPSRDVATADGARACRRQGDAARIDIASRAISTPSVRGAARRELFLSERGPAAARRGGRGDGLRRSVNIDRTCGW